MMQKIEAGQKAYVFDDPEDVVEILGVDPNNVDNQGNQLLLYRDVDGQTSGSISPQALTAVEES